MAVSSEGSAAQVPASAPRLARTVLVAATAAIGGFLFGYDTAVINGAVTAVDQAFGVAAIVLGFAVAIALLGAALGAWYAGPVADRFGRIPVMVVAAVLFAVSAFGSGFAFSIWDLAFWRFVGGIGVGAASVIAPAYIAEIAPAHIRGRLGSLQQMAIVIGIFVALLVDYALVLASGSASAELWFGIATWRWMFLSLFIPALVYGALALTIPESPRYLVAKQQLQRAGRVLRRFVGGDIDEKLREIARTLTGAERGTFATIRGYRFGLLPIVWVGIGLSVFQQFTGINVIFYYSSVLWRAVGFSEENALAITVITSVTNIVATVIAIALVDKVGRRPMLLVGSIGQFACLATLAVVFGTAPVIDGEPNLVGAAAPIALIAANLYVVFFGVTWGPVVWVLLGEMFGNRIRAMAIAVGAAAQWIANFIVSTTFPALSSVGLGLAYGIYTFFAFLSIWFVLKFIRETKGRELEEMASS